MILLASKAVSVLVTPLGFCLLLAAAGLVTQRLGWRRLGTVLAATGLLLLWVAATPMAARLALGTLERQYPARPIGGLPQADAAIVLGGSVAGAAPPRPGIDLGDASDRVLAAALLFRAGKVKAIIISGGNLPWSPAMEPEAETMRQLLAGWGVPARAIITAGQSRTTAENAREVQALWPGLGFTSALLVTSAFHMPRALATFRAAGLPVSPAATDVRVVDAPLTPLDLLPDAASLANTSLAVKEWAGYAVYRLRGDI